MTLDDWAIRWGVSAAALVELRAMWGIINSTNPTTIGADPSEAGVQMSVRLEATEKRLLLWRNNVGALLDKDGRLVRYGLANDSKALNEKIKSGDLIGIRPVTIGAEHIGHVIGQFVSRETKFAGWKFKGDAREMAQLRWIELVASAGGDAAFTTGPGSL